MDLNEQYYRLAEAERKLIEVRDGTDAEDAKAFVLEAIQHLRDATRLISRKLKSKELQCNS